MKEWEITFVDQKGVPTRLPFQSEQQPSTEEAAREIRRLLFPVMDKADLNDFEGRANAPTALWLKEQNGVEITAITLVA